MWQINGILLLLLLKGSMGNLNKNKITFFSFFIGTLSRSNWNLEVLVFAERRKLEYPDKNLLEQGREQQQTQG